MARATGCSLSDSTARARCLTITGSSPGAAKTSASVIRPVVRVPVLSSTMVSTRRVSSSTSGPRMRIPSWAPRPVPTSSAVGVARPSAHGHAMMRTATAAVNDACTSPVRSSHASSVSMAITRTAGTKTAETRSARRCTGALPACASTTSRVMWARWVSAPTRVAVTVRVPSTLTVAPVTGSPGATSTGTGSPVSREVSTALSPETTTPSVAIRSPGRTTNTSPTLTCEAGTLVSTPSTITEASWAARLASALRALVERRFARASNHRPASRKTGTAAATSK